MRLLQPYTVGIYSQNSITFKFIYNVAPCDRSDPNKHSQLGARNTLSRETRRDTYASCRLKQRVRNVIDPGRGLGHSDGEASAEEGTQGAKGAKKEPEQETEEEDGPSSRSGDRHVQLWPNLRSPTQSRECPVSHSDGEAWLHSISYQSQTTSSSCRPHAHHLYPRAKPQVRQRCSGCSRSSAVRRNEAHGESTITVPLAAAHRLLNTSSPIFTPALTPSKGHAERLTVGTRPCHKG